jgi:hypothetical protein
VCAVCGIGLSASALLPNPGTAQKAATTVKTEPKRDENDRRAPTIVFTCVIAAAALCNGLSVSSDDFRFSVEGSWEENYWTRHIHRFASWRKSVLMIRFWIEMENLSNRLL